MVVTPAPHPLSPRNAHEASASHGTQSVVYPRRVTAVSRTPTGEMEYQAPLIVAIDGPLRLQPGAQQLYRPHVTSCTTRLPSGRVIHTPIVLSSRNTPPPMRTISQMEVLSGEASSLHRSSGTPTPRTLSTAASSLTNASRSQDSVSLYHSGESSGSLSTPRVVVGSGGQYPNFLYSPAQVEAQLQEEILALNNLPPQEQDLALRRIRLLNDLKRQHKLLARSSDQELVAQFNRLCTLNGGYSSNISSPRTVQRSGIATQGATTTTTGSTSAYARHTSENNLVTQGASSSPTALRDRGRLERINRLQNELRIYYESLMHVEPLVQAGSVESYHTTSVPSSPRIYDYSATSVQPASSPRSSSSISQREAYAVTRQGYVSPRSIIVSESSQESYFDIGCGLHPDVIQEFPISRYHSSVSESSEERKSCTICLEDFVAAEVVRRLPCTHAYHTRCIDEWLLRSTKCPICKWDCVGLLV